MATNKNAATEDDVGYLHSALTKLFKAKLDALLALVEECGDNAMIATIVQGKDLQAIATWVEKNGITATPADFEGVNELTEKLKKLKERSANKVIPFVKEG